jgi:hypothetical protein
VIAPIGILDPEVSAVVYSCYETGGFTTRSDFARQNAEAVAAAACQGFITTEVPREGFTTAWRCTPLGLDAIFINGGRPSTLYKHGGLPDAFIASLTERPQRELH